MTNSEKTLSKVFSTENMEKIDLMIENTRLRERIRRLEYWLDYVVNSSLTHPEVEKSAREVLEDVW